MNIADWKDLIALVGVPAAVLGVVFYIIFRFGRWLGPRAEQVVTGHIEFLKISQENQTQQTTTLAQQGELLGKTVRALSHCVDAADHALDNEQDETKQLLEKAREELTPE